MQPVSSFFHFQTETIETIESLSIQVYHPLSHPPVSSLRLAHFHASSPSVVTFFCPSPFISLCLPSLPPPNSALSHAEWSPKAVNPYWAVLMWIPCTSMSEWQLRVSRWGPPAPLPACRLEWMSQTQWRSDCLPRYLSMHWWNDTYIKLNWTRDWFLGARWTELQPFQ